MRRAILILTLLAAALWSAPSLAQSRSQLGPLCTTDTTPADQQIDACNKIIALKVFSGEKLATIYFWRAVGWNKKGNYAQVIADAGEAIRLQPSVAALQSARLGLLRQGRVRHRDMPISTTRCGSGRRAASSFTTAATPGAARANTPRRSPTTINRSRLGPPSAFSWQNRGISKLALGDLDGALADINEAIRLDPTLPQPLTNRAVIWRAKGDLDRAIADTTEAIRLAKAKAPVNIMTPPGSVLISAYSQRALAYEAKGDIDRAKQDYAAALEGRPPTPAARPTRPPQRFACRCCRRRCRPRRERQPQRHRRRPAQRRQLRRRAPRARPRLPQRSSASAQRPTEKPSGASRW